MSFSRGKRIPYVSWLALIVATLALWPPHALAGGGAENLVLIINPAYPESMYIGNYYKNARNVPDANVLYMNPWDLNFSAFTAQKVDSLVGSLANKQIDNHIDYVLVSPTPEFYVNIPSSNISSGCPGNPVTRIAMSSAYTLAHLATAINAGGQTETRPNQFYSTTDAARAFSHSTKWLNGLPSASGSAEQYYLGFLLGYITPLSNTANELLQMIDRSVATDGTRPAGTFYFMKTPDTVRSNPRDPHFPAAIAAIQSFGGQAVQIEGQFLPTGHHDCLGVMTGASDPGIDAATMTILPGAFCDHLTSFAGTLDSALQEKMTRWIAKGNPANGASGTAGTVQEPCVFGPGITGKFPHPRLHVWYYQGASLGEALFRSLQWTPYQTLFYGDPLTRPFSYLPVVTVPDAPAGVVSGTIPLTPSATTPHPTAAISRHDLYVDGIRLATVNVGGAFSLNTTTLADGVHDVRVVSYDNTLLETQGRWIGTISTNNFSRSVTLGANSTTGDLSTLFNVTVNAAGGTVTEVRLLQNDRVLAAAGTASAAFSLLGDVFGAGPVRLIAEAEFSDGKRARSTPLNLTVTFANPPAGATPNHAPVAYSFYKEVKAPKPLLLELPGSDLEDRLTIFAVIAGPSQGTLQGSGATVLLRPNLNATGTDTVLFVVHDGQVASNTATITIRYMFEADLTPPTPNPMTFAAPPAPFSGFQTISINMTATTATDPTGPIQYKFDESSGSPGGSSSNWQAGTSYIDGGLTPNTLYTYAVKARDGNLNETTPSTPTSTATWIQEPTGLTAGAITSSSIVLNATGTFTNLNVGQSGILFESLTPGGNGGISEWVQATTDTATGLQPNTTYMFRVKSRNRLGVEFSDASPVTASFTTLPGPACAVLGDVNSDGNVNGLDVAGFTRVKLGQGGPGDNAACANYGSGTVQGDISLFVLDLLNE